LSYKKTKLIPGNIQPIEIQEEFIKEYEHLKVRAEKGEIHLLFFDPTHQVHNTVNGTCWQTTGKRGTVRLSSNTGRKRVSVVGAINAITGGCTTMMTEHNCDKEMIIATFHEVRKTYSDDKEIVMILDNASYNHAYKTRDNAELLGIRLMFLPTYSPNLNLIERLWKFLKKVVVKNKYYKTFAEFKNAITSFFENINIYKEPILRLLNHKFEILKAE
jgi:transposase